MQQIPLKGNSIFTRLFFTPFENRSEDCLYLNVWTSASAGDKRPVMVWIPGGGFRGGSSAGEIYDGAEFAKRGVVLVSINYRVWKFGFLAHPDLSKESEHGVSGNYGLLDQIAALRWVKENIAAFGGNPDNVTIFGQLAGSSSATFLMASPPAKGLFHRVIGESGGGFAPAVGGSPLGRTLETLAEAEAVGARFMAALKAKSIADMRKFRLKRSTIFLPAVTNPRCRSWTAMWCPPPWMRSLRAGSRTTFRCSPARIRMKARISRHCARCRRSRTMPANPSDPSRTRILRSTRPATIWRRSGRARSRCATPASTGRTGNGQRAGAHRQVQGFLLLLHPPSAGAAERAICRRPGKDLGAYHGAEIAYVFGNFVPREWAWSDADRALEKVICAILGELRDHRRSERAGPSRLAGLCS